MKSTNGSSTTRKALVSGLVGALLAGSLVGTTEAFGGRGHGDGFGGGRMGGERFVERMAEPLDLTQEQITTIRDIMDESRAERRGLKDHMRATRTAIAESMQGETLDEEALRPLAEAQGDAIAEMIVLRARMHMEMNAVLTDEQRERLEQFRSERHGRRR